MSSLTWKIIPVFTLTVRQFAGGKAVRVVAALACIPTLFALIYLINPDVDEPGHFVMNAMFRGVVAATLLPITVLILATGALGNEIEDNTLPYLILKPISRLRIVIEKFLGVVAVAGPLILAGLALTFLLAFRGQAGDNLRMLGAIAAATGAGIVTYAALFLLVSLFISRALLAGIIYSLVWESLLGRFLPGLRLISIRHFVESIAVRVLDDPSYQVRGAMTLQSSLLTLGITSAFALLLATWRLRRLNLD